MGRRIGEDRHHLMPVVSGYIGDSSAINTYTFAADLQVINVGVGAHIGNPFAMAKEMVAAWLGNYSEPQVGIVREQIRQAFREL